VPPDEEELLEDINNIADNKVLKEETRSTDMKDFDEHLKKINAERTKNVEIQPDPIKKRHMKLGPTPRKLGILRDAETFIDRRMFREGTDENYKIATV